MTDCVLRKPTHLHLCSAKRAGSMNIILCCGVEPSETATNLHSNRICFHLRAEAMGCSHFQCCDAPPHCCSDWFTIAL